jgi:hypothetical protein
MGGMVSVLVLMCGQAFADGVIEKRVAADTPEKFKQVEVDIRNDMNPGGRYEFIRPDEKVKVEADMTLMESMLQKAGSVNAMPDRDKVRLYNTQENLNGLLTHSDSNRLVCERAASLGSHIQTTTCKTVGEIERVRRAIKDKLQQIGRDSSFCNNSHILGCRNN